MERKVYTDIGQPNGWTVVDMRPFLGWTSKLPFGGKFPSFCWKAGPCLLLHKARGSRYSLSLALGSGGMNMCPGLHQSWDSKTPASNANQGQLAIIHSCGVENLCLWHVAEPKLNCSCGVTLTVFSCPSFSCFSAHFLHLILPPSWHYVRY